MVIHYNRPQKRGTLAQRLWRDRHAAEIQAQQNRFFAPRGRRDRLHDQRLQAIADQRDSEYAIIQDDIEPGPRWTPQRDDSDDDYDRAVYAERAQWRQRAKDFNWKSVMPALHSWFMALKLKTKNWTIATSNEDHGNCKCAPHKLTRRWVDLVDVNWQGRRRIPFCECSSDAARLLHYGYIAASPISPQTAFSLSLLIFHNSMWNNCHVKAQPFMLAMTEWLEPRSERLHVRGKKHARDLCKPFSAAVDLYRMLENMADDTISEALCLNAQEIQALEGCLACFGPRPPNLADYSAKTRDKLIICFDGNFQHRHHTKAGRQYRPIENPRIFVPPADFTQMQEAIRAREVADTAPEKADRCADSHKAADDKRNESTWKGCDDTGLMGACCPHDAAIMMVNIYKSGEQRCFPVTMLNKLLTQCEGDRQVGILYDIGCSLDKYMDARGILEEYRPRLSFGTSVFHAYVHNWICQLDYHPRLNDGWGLSDGEGLERLWSYLSPLVSALRYATRNHRLAAIAHRLKYHNWKGKRDLPKWLKNKFTSAVKRRHEASGVLVGLSVMRNRHVATGANYTKSFFKDQWKAQRVFQKQHTEAEANRRGKLVAFYKQEVVVELLRKRLQGPEIFLSTEQEVLDLLASITGHSEALRRQLDELTGEPEMRSVVNDEESKLLLLLWDAKAELFVQAVHHQAENRPITDSKTIGARTGTRIKENVFKAQQTRKPAVKKYIKTFNRRYLDYITRYPDQTLSDAADYPLTYEEFIEFPMDHRFWNDGLYYHSKAPWAIDANVRAGITATLTLCRVEEEFDLLAQELCRAIGWGVAYYNRLFNTIGSLQGRLATLNLGNVPLEPDHIDAITLYGVAGKTRYKLLSKELSRRLETHGAQMDEWSETVIWLWNRCQPRGNRGFISNWNEMIRKIRNGNITLAQEGEAEVDEQLESTVLEVEVDDGEDVDVALISEVEGAVAEENEVVGRNEDASGQTDGPAT
ncbi:hypothetical protein MJO28_010368 [Puccinia striiformis f. sp. tritici]|uniref:Uncharacterized protein n=1 Tax=Puccinia striiformis f. sp. tritici TaxID=168172 RepID=A0ACC0E6A1_9BASI|nr:hypothetical protein MJO28_010368 [Puccinia striiformis f. sp. tritici]